MREKISDNSQYTDGFPTNDNPDKKEGIKSRDPSRPFDSGKKEKVDKDHNPTGTTMNEPNKYKK